MQKTVIFLNRQQISKRIIIANKEGPSSQHKVHRTVSNCIKGNGGLVQLMQTVCFDKIVRFVLNRERDEKRNENMTTLLNILSKHSIEVLVALVRKRLLFQVCT